MRVSFTKKDNASVKNGGESKNDQTRSIARLFGVQDVSSAAKAGEKRPERITSFGGNDSRRKNEETKEGHREKGGLRTADEKPIPPRKPILIYDPASLGKEAWLASQGTRDASGIDEDEELGPSLSKEDAVRTGESMLAKVAKNRNIGQEPEIVDYNKCSFEDYGRNMLLQMGLDPDSEDAVPDISYKPRPYAQAGLGADIKLPSAKKDTASSNREHQR